MEKERELLFVALEYDKNVPRLDLHGVHPNDIENSIVNFLLDLIQKNKHSAQIIYGRGGSGILRQKTNEFLNKNMRETDINHRLVKAWKESVLQGAGGRCLILVEG
jgi:DNA-nicking Smr family endonuclease